MESTTQLDCLVRKTRLFDTDIRVQPSISELYDVATDIIMPSFAYYDVVVNYIRYAAALVDPFEASKEDTASFFSMYERKENVIQSTYISSNLKVMEALSEEMLKPVSRFTSVTPIAVADMGQSGTDDYVAIDFKDIISFDTLEMVRTGFTCIIAGVQEDTPVCYSVADLSAAIDVSDLRWCGITDAFKLNSNVQSTAYCSIYYGIMHVNNDHTYYFSTQLATTGVFSIDDNIIHAQWTADSTTAQESSVYLSKGYHTFLLRQYASADTTVDIVRMSVKAEEGDAYMAFTVANCAVIGMQLTTFPPRKSELTEQGAMLMEQPSDITDVSLDSLYLKEYRPTIVLARVRSVLLQQEFNRIYYLRTPTSIKHSAVLSGDITTLSTNVYDFGYTGVGVVLEGNLSVEPSPYITYVYAVSTTISQFEIADTSLYDDAQYNGDQCKGFTFSIVDANNVRMSSADIVALVDLDACENVSAVQVCAASETYVEVLKENYKGTVIVTLVSAIAIKEITVRDPIISSLQWGVLTLFRVYAKALELVSMIDNKGETSILDTVNPANLSVIDYDNIGFIPSVFEHKSIAPDIQYGGEFIMFCLNVLSSPSTISILGSTHVLHNDTDIPIYAQDVAVHIDQTDITTPHLFSIYADIDKTELYNFTYLCYNSSTNKIEQTDYSSVQLSIHNTGAAQLTNAVVDVVVPNVVIGYTSTIDIVGVDSTGALTSDPLLWDTDYVRIQIPVIDADQTLVYTLTHGTFSDPSTITGAQTTVCTDTTDVHKLPLCIVRVPEVPAHAATNMYVMGTTVPPVLNNTLVYDAAQFLTMGTVLVTDTSGINRTDVEVIIDISALTHVYGQLPFCAYDSSTRQPIDTIGINNDDSTTSDFNEWDGYRISFRIPLLQGGQSSLFLLRLASFQGDASSFLNSVQTDMTHNYHFAGTLVNSIDGVLGIDHGVFYNSDRELSAYAACEFINNGTAQLTATTNVTDFTVSFWFQTTDAGGLVSFAAEALPATTTDLLFSTTVDNYLQCTIRAATDVVLVAADKSYVDNQWHHVVLTVDAITGCVLYTDKKVQDSNDVVIGRQTTTAYVHLGWADTYAHSKIDEFRIYTKVLSIQEVNTLYTVFDGTYNDIAAQYSSADSTIAASNAVTSLFDLSASDGTPLHIYKYIGINESIVRWV